MEHPDRWTMEDPGYGHAPVICADTAGRYCAAWISWLDNTECVRVSFRNPEQDWSAPFVCSDSSSFVTGLTIAPFGDGVMLAWIDSDGLKLVSATSSGTQETNLVVSSGNQPMHPTLSSFESKSGETCFALAWSELRESKRQVFACLGQSVTSTSPAMEISSGGDHNTRPSIACLEQDALVAWQSMGQGDSCIVARRFNEGNATSPVIDVSPKTRGISAVPDVTRSADGGVWVAWQSDYDEDDGPGLVRWIEVVHVDSEDNVNQPLIPMPGVNRKGEGEDQGFEAPALAVLKDGRLVVIGRGSQSIRRQDLGASGWSEAVQVDDPGWQCRGHRFDAYPAANGVLVAGRERGDVVVRFLGAGQSEFAGSPELSASPMEHNPILSLPPTYNHIVAGRRVLFGDIHQHTAASDGTGTWEETYCRARYRYGDQLAVISDHESFLGKRTPPGQWVETCLAADEANQQGSFVTLYASEWTGKMHPGPGHKVVYLPPSGGPVLSRDDELTKTSQGLIRETRRLGGLVFPHHVGWTGADASAHDPTVQTCFEMVSCHGAYERPGAGPIGTRGDDKNGQFVAETLDDGHRFGFVGGSDGHGLDWHHGICRKRDSHRTGLTAVFPDETSREGVMDALANRRCYATSGAKIRLWFEIDGRPMGEELVTSDPLPFRVVVSATDNIESVSLVTNQGQEIELETDAKSTEVNTRGTISPPISGSWCFYYVRVIQTDKEVAWSSPIWLDSPSTA